MVSKGHLNHSVLQIKLVFWALSDQIEPIFSFISGSARTLKKSELWSGAPLLYIMLVFILSSIFFISVYSEV